MAKKLFVGNLSWNTTDGSLSEFFAQAGNVVSAVVITDKFSGKSRGFGFVEMSTDEEAEAAKQLNGKVLDDREISVNDARPQAPRDNSQGFSSGSSRGGFERRDTQRRFDRRDRGSYRR